MAIREDELAGQEDFADAKGAAIYPWPVAERGARVARRRMLARRRRAAVIAALLVVGLGIMPGALVRPEGASAPHSPRTLVLGPGDSLWSAAERFAPPDADLRAYVNSLVTLNDLQGAPVPGERLRLPAAP